MRERPKVTTAIAGSLTGLLVVAVVARVVWELLAPLVWPLAIGAVLVLLGARLLLRGR